MKRFDFRSKLKGLNIEQLKRMRESQLDFWHNALLFDEKDADRYMRYIGYIDDAINKIN